MTNIDRQDQTSSFYIGLCLAIISTIFIGTSYTIKKLALQRLAKSGIRSSDGGYGYLKDRVWWCGFLSMGIGEAANFLAYTFAPATVVTPLGALSIIVNSFTASYYLKERLNLHGKFGVILTILGSTMVVLTAPEETDVSDFYQVRDQICKPAFILYASVAVSISLYLIFVVEPQHGRTNMFVYILICSIIGGFSVSCMKGIGVMIRQFLSPDKNYHLNILTEPLAYVLIIALVISITTQVNYLNRSLDVFDASLVTPIYYVLFTTSVLTCTSILYDEWENIDRRTDVVVLFAGFGIIVIGIVLLHSFKSVDVTFREVLDRRTQHQRTDKNSLFKNIHYERIWILGSDNANLRTI